MRFKSFILMIAGVALTCCSGESSPAPVNPGTTVDPSQATANDLVIYEANVRMNGTGGLAVLNDQIPTLKQMGINVLWLMPIYEMGVEKSVNSPYCIKNYKAVDSKLGTLDDVKNIVKNAHAAGMKVILDWVANHTSFDAVWTATPSWYRCDGSGNITATDMWGDVAELNFNNKEMRAEMINCMLYWVNEVGVDGYRCDYTDGVPHDFWKEAIAAVKKAKADAIMLSESESPDYYKDGFDMVYDWKYASIVQNLFNGKSSPAQFFENSQKELDKVATGKISMRYTLNHDAASEKSMATLFGDEQGCRTAQLLTMMLDCVPLVYTGHIVDYSGKLSFFDYKKYALNNEKVDYYSAINAVYHDTRLARSGKLVTYANDKLVVLSRSHGGQKMLFVANPTATEQTIKLPMAFAGSKMYNGLTKAVETVPGFTDLAPHDCLIFYTK